MDPVEQVAQSSVLEHSPDAGLLPAHVGAWQVEHRTQVVSWDARCAELLQVRATSASLQEQLNKVHPDEREQVALALDRTFQTGRPYQVRLRLAQLAGGYAWYLSGGRLIDAGHEGPRIIGALTRLPQL